MRACSDATALSAGRHRLTVAGDPAVQIAGGLAGFELGSFSDWVTWQYLDGRAYTDGVSAVLVQGLGAEIAVSHGCEPLGVTFDVTRSDGALVAELDGRPAFDALREYLDGDARDLSANDDLHLVLGLPVDASHRDGYGDLLIRAPIRLLEGGALFFTGGGRAVTFSLVMSAVGLFAIGSGISLFTGRGTLFSGLRQMLFGLLAAAVTYGVGWLMGVSLAG